MMGPVESIDEARQAHPSAIATARQIRTAASTGGRAPTSPAMRSKPATLDPLLAAPPPRNRVSGPASTRSAR